MGKNRKKDIQVDETSTMNPSDLNIGKSDFCVLFDAIDSPVSFLDKDFRYHDVNQAYEKYLGISKQDIIGKTPAIIIGENTFEADIKPKLERCMRGEQISFSIWVDYPKMGKRFMEVLYSPKIASDGTIQGILHISRDFTEKYYLEKKAASIIETAFSCFFVIDMQGRIVEANERATEMLGYDRRELLSKSIWEIDTLEDESDTLQRINEIRKLGSIQFESQQRCKNGKSIEVEVSATYSDHDGGVIYAFIRDLTPFKDKERELKESEARFKALHNASFGGIAIHDKGMILDCNLGLAEISGHPVSDLIGMNGLLLIAERSRSEVMRNILSGYEKPYEVFGVRKNGEEYPVRLEARNIPYKGRMVRAVEFRDITEIRRSMEEKAALKARLGALWHISRMVGASYRELCDLVLEEIQNLTQSRYSFFGFINGRESDMSIHSWSRDAMQECAIGDKPLCFPVREAGIWAKAVIDRQPVIIDDYERTTEPRRGLPPGHVPIRSLLSVPIIRDDRVVALAAVANKATPYTSDDINQITAFASSAILLLEQRRIKNELKASEERLSLAVEMAHMAHWEMDIDTLTFTFNDQFYSLYGTTAEREGGFTMSAEAYAEIFVHPDEIGLVSAEIGKILAGEYDDRPAQLEHRIVKRSGDIRTIIVRYMVLSDKAGRRVKTIGVNQDITERKLAEEALTSAKEKAEAASRAKNEFLANMSHEIRTPLNGIVGMMQLLQTTDLDGEQEEYVDMAIRSSNRLTRLLSDILDISRVEAGRLEFVRREFRVQDLTHSVVELFDDDKHPDQRVRFSCLVDPATPESLVGDEARIRQILFNLVGNAFKFTEQGSVTLEIYPIPSTRPDELRLVFSVRDTGVGIPENKLRDLFTPFTQVETTYNRTYQGAGLGLAIVKRLVTMMGGHIVMDTAPGQGTSANVILPFEGRPRPDPADTPAPPTRQDALAPLNILLAEDDPANRYFIRNILEKMKIRLWTAENGHEVLELWKAQDFDCILMDIQMPVMDGIETTKRIRNSHAGAKADIPIIALTSYAMAGDQEKFLAAGMDAYLSKPVQLADLTQAIKAACRKR